MQSWFYGEGLSNNDTLVIVGGRGGKYPNSYIQSLVNSGLFLGEIANAFWGESLNELAVVENLGGGM